jgi:hypothetical protein
MILLFCDFGKKIADSLRPIFLLKAIAFLLQKKVPVRLLVLEL